MCCNLNDSRPSVGPDVIPGGRRQRVAFYEVFVGVFYVIPVFV